MQGRGPISAFHVGKASQCKLPCCNRQPVIEERTVDIRRRVMIEVGERAILRVRRDGVPKPRSSPPRLTKSRVPKRPRPPSIDQDREMMPFKRPHLTEPSSYSAVCATHILTAAGIYQDQPVRMPLPEESEIVRLIEIARPDGTRAHRLVMPSPSTGSSRSSGAHSEDVSDSDEEERVVQDLTLDGEAEPSDMRGDDKGNPSARYQSD